MRNFFMDGILNVSLRLRRWQLYRQSTSQNKRNFVPFRSLQNIIHGKLISLLLHFIGQERIFG